MNKLRIIFLALIMTFLCTSTALAAWSITFNKTAYDLDHFSQPNKGIIQEKWSWREATSPTWINGYPSTLQDNKDYLIKYEVQDKEGAWSLPDIKLISTRNINLPPVALFTVTPNPVVAGKALTYNDASYSPTGKTIIKRSWRYQNPAGTWSAVSSTPPASFTTVGKYKIELIVSDGIMSSEPYYQDVEVIPDNNPPTVSFTMTPATNFYDYEPVTYNVSYSDPNGDPCGGYQWALRKNGGRWFYLSNPPSNYEAPGPGNYVLALRAIDIPRYPQQEAKWSHPSPDPNTWFKRTFTVLEGFVMRGDIIPAPAERGRKIRIFARAVRPSDLSTRVDIDSATATIIDTSTGKAPAGFTPTTINLAYDSASKDWYGDYKIPDHVTQKGKWPDDGTYEVIVTGRKALTVKDYKVPFTVKGHILDRTIIVTQKLH